MTAIYLDHNASTPVHPEVAAVMHRLIDTAFGNPSSGHWAGTHAKVVLDRARAQVAALLGAHPDEIVFTSGGSEANNHALKGVFHARGDKGAHIVISAVEHPAVVAPCRFLESLGARLTVLPVDATGRVDPADLARALGPDTALVSIMHANNEVGTLQPIAELAAIAKARGVPFHTDAAQSVGKIAARVDELGVDLLSIAGHKLRAPKGIGALYIRRGTALSPLVHGAGHESGRRAGTESALLAGALGAACALHGERPDGSAVAALRDRLWHGLVAAFGNQVVLNGHPQHRLPNTLNVSFPGHIGAEILSRMPDVAASTGSACHAGSLTMSPTLSAMGVAPAIAAGSIRFSLGHDTSRGEIDAVLGQLTTILAPVD